MKSELAYIKEWGGWQCFLGSIITSSFFMSFSGFHNSGHQKRIMEVLYGDCTSSYDNEDKVRRLVKVNV